MGSGKLPPDAEPSPVEDGLMKTFLLALMLVPASISAVSQSAIDYSFTCLTSDCSG
jgi:hypothetical protein